MINMSIKLQNEIGDILNLGDIGVKLFIIDLLHFGQQSGNALITSTGVNSSQSTRLHLENVDMFYEHF